VLLLLKFAALHALLEASASASMPNLPLLVIVIAPMLVRIVPSLLFLTTPYVRQHGLGSALVTGLPRRGWFLSSPLLLSAYYCWQAVWVCGWCLPC